MAQAPSIPTIFEMRVEDDGYRKAYLNNKDYSAYPEEKEVLLGGV